MRHPYASIKTLFFHCAQSFDYMVRVEEDQMEELAVYYMWDGIT